MRILTPFLLFIFLFAVEVHAQETVERTNNGTIILEDFEADPGGDLPQHWYDRDGNKKLVNHDKDFSQHYHYTIRKDAGNKFLRYQGVTAKHINLPLINENKENIYDINLYETPILSWKVRAHELPKGANEKSSDLNDSVASIYVVFDMGRVALVKKVPKSIRYTWSTTLPKGETGSKLFGNQQIIVVESGEDKKGEWVTFERNLVKDYRDRFGDDPPKHPLAILILSDGNSTNSYVKADYDDIMLKPAK
ncbi:DUF3047 domain-containing protein [Fodinibius sp.]|uniref:DUF3047 domain-containing protein n=1 Tax=Fodinibius sp. TaxID=1872440 RepID=UPI002ACECFD4|nr:DUF3047 domain-containing protein [Fodinibius sp.]MDZ7659817.1 DUF3047 domain-containing protein [Fodinibius sp.]